MKKILHFIGSVGAAFVRSCPRIASQPTLYPEVVRKSWMRRYLEILFLRFRDGAVCHAYNGLGLDVKGSRWRDYIVEGCRYRKMTRFSKFGKVDYTCLLEDKYLFYLYLKSHNMAVAPVMAYFDGENGWIDGKCYAALPDFLNMINIAMGESPHIFVKAIDGWCGLGVRKIAMPLTEDVFKDGYKLILQPRVENIEELKVINPTTLNTLRIATCWHNGDVDLWDSGMIRIGRKGCDVDNFFQGGIGVGIAGDGTLRKFGYCHDKSMVYKKITQHPDSGISFEKYKVPYYKESVELVKSAHRLFPSIPSIGWDVCVTTDGPLILEGNHDWDVEMLQIVHNYSAKEKYDTVYSRLIEGSSY